MRSVSPSSKRMCSAASSMLWIVGSVVLNHKSLQIQRVSQVHSSSLISRTLHMELILKETFLWAHLVCALTSFHVTFPLTLKQEFEKACQLLTTVIATIYQHTEPTHTRLLVNMLPQVVERIKARLTAILNGCLYNACDYKPTTLSFNASNLTLPSEPKPQTTNLCLRRKTRRYLLAMQYSRVCRIQRSRTLFNYM